MNIETDSVAELLKHADSPGKTEQIKSLVSSKANTLTRHLAAASHAQLAQTSSGIEALSEAKKEIITIKESLASIKSTSSSSLSSPLAPLSSVKEEDENLNLNSNLNSNGNNNLNGSVAAQRTALIHKRFVLTLSLVKRLSEFPIQMNKIKKLMIENSPYNEISQSGTLEDLNAPLPYLLNIHMLLTPQRQLFDTVKAYTSMDNSNSNTNSNSYSLMLQNYFSSLINIVEILDTLIFDIAASILEITREGNYSLIVRTAKIIQAEENADRNASLLASVLNSSSNSNSNSSSLVNISNAAPRLSSLMDKNSLYRPPRKYLERFLNSLKNSIKLTFQNCENTYLPNNIPEIFQNLLWIYQDIGLSFSLLAPLVPPQWDLPTKILSYYHTELRNLIQKIIQLEPDAHTILQITAFVKEYNPAMLNAIKEYSSIPIKDLNIEAIDQAMQPPLLDNDGNNLLNDYMDLIISKMLEWMENLSKSEHEAFLTRTDPPSTETEDGRYGLPGTQTLFVMISQQFDLAEQSGQARVLARVVDSCAGALLDRQRQWEHLMISENNKKIATDSKGINIPLSDPNASFTSTAASSSNLSFKSPDLSSNSNPPPGLAEYIVALANDQIRAADYTEAILGRLAPIVSRKYRPQITAALESVIDGYAALGHKCLRELAKSILSDAAPSLSTFFTQKWYKTGISPAKAVIETIEDYVSDLKDQISPDIWDLFVDHIIELTLVVYLGSFKFNASFGVIMKPAPICIDHIKADTAVFYDLFSSLAPEEYVQSLFAAIEHTLELLAIDIDINNPSELIAVYSAFLNDFPDTPLTYVKDVLSARQDIDSKTVKKCLQKLSEAVPVAPPPLQHPTIIAQIYIKSSQD